MVIASTILVDNIELRKPLIGVFLYEAKIEYG